MLQLKSSSIKTKTESYIRVDTKKLDRCHKLHSACISTTSGPIFTNQVALKSPKWGLSAHMWKVQEQQQMTEILDHQ